MASTQIDLATLAKTIQEAYENSVEPSFDQKTRHAFQVRADALSQQFDQLSGRWFDDQTKAYQTANDNLDAALKSMQADLDSIKAVKAALDELTSLIGAITGLLSILAA